MRAHRYALLFWAMVGLGCGPDARNTGPNCTSLCTALGFQQCREDGSFDPPVLCGPDETCSAEHGCVVCVPDELYCGGNTGNDILRCNGKGTEGTYVESCPMDQACSGGQCKTPCEAAEDNPSNVGCDFWAADLDNEATSGLISNDAAAQQFALVAANNNDFAITVRVYKNAANIGQPVNEQMILQVNVPPRTAQRMDLPMREVDGSMQQNGTYMQNSGSGTFVSPHAMHVVSTGPMVLYQFNPIIQQFSNDASTLIPKQALGMDYIVVGFETANPCGITGLPAPDPSIPDHGAVTIIPLEDNTNVTVTTAHGIKASGGASGINIPMVPKGGTLNLTLSRYMAANLESEMKTGSVSECAQAVNGGADGDFTGTYVKSDKPVVVFTSNERGIGFGGATNVEYAPGWDPMNGDDTCCTDHLEEQLFPVTALGKEFAVARSPLRSTHATWKEPDIIRVVGTADGTTVTTNLPAPWNSFTVNARQDKTFAATSGFTLSASAAIQISSYLVPGHFVKYGYTGDPSQIMVPAAEQHRKDYVFLVPGTFQLNYAVFAKPIAAKLVVDGVALDGVEFSSCVKAPIGTVLGTQYEQVTCPLQAGHHKVTGDMPFGLAVYGYYNVGSYAFVGGSDVKIINPIL